MPRQKSGESEKYPAPSAEHIRRVRETLGMSQEQAAAVIYRPVLAWKRWEAGAAKLELALWEYWQLLVGLVTLPELRRRRRDD